MLTERSLPPVNIHTLGESFVTTNDLVKLFYYNCNLSIKQARQIDEDTSPVKFIIIYNGTGTCQAKALLHEHRTSLFPLDFFHYVPIDYFPNIKYRIMSKEEKHAMGSKIKYRHLPKILDSDVISMYFGANTGDIFEIHRKTGIYYRLVITQT